MTFVDLSCLVLSYIVLSGLMLTYIDFQRFITTWFSKYLYLYTKLYKHALLAFKVLLHQSLDLVCSRNFPAVTNTPFIAKWVNTWQIHRIESACIKNLDKVDFLLIDGIPKKGIQLKELSSCQGKLTKFRIQGISKLVISESCLWIFTSSLKQHSILEWGMISESLLLD